MGGCLRDAFHRRLEYNIERATASRRWFCTRSSVIKALMIGAFLVAFLILLLGIYFLDKEKRSVQPPETGFPDSIRIDRREWPDHAGIDGVCKVDDCAVVYSQSGYFAVFHDDALLHMLYAPGQKCGIFRNRIFTINGDFAYLYDAEGALEERLNAAVVADWLISTGAQATITPYVYRVVHETDVDRVLVETDGTATELLSHPHAGTNPYKVAGYICLGICAATIFSLVILIIVKSAPDVFDVMRKYGKIN